MEELKPLPLWQYGLLIYALGMAAGFLVAMAVWGLAPGERVDKPPATGQGISALGIAGDGGIS